MAKPVALRCRDVEERWPDAFRDGVGCCVSCHEDEAEGFDGLMRYAPDENPQGYDIVVCCAIQRVLVGVGVLDAIAL